MRAIDILRMGGERILDSWSMTTGNAGTAPNRVIGFFNGLYGTMSPGTSAIYGGAIVNRLTYDESTGNLILGIAGIQPNSGWTSIQLGPYGTYLRSAASYTAPSSTTWTWAGASAFGIGITIPVTFR